ncbi:MAG: type II toxin-antitoxin system HipA family toxin [Atopobiaceae bacterium]
MRLKVTIEIAGKDVFAGTLSQQVRRGVEAASFTYDAAYLERPDAFPLASDMPLTAGSFHSRGLAQFRVFEDAMPDRWGRNLLLRGERRQAKVEDRAERAFFETDYLVGANDETRQGALRFWDEEKKCPLARPDEGVPKEVDLPDLLDAADGTAAGDDADIHDLISAGSSLGGARPKASVRDGAGNLLIVKFPRADEGELEDVAAWEKTMLVLMAKCGIQIPRSRLLRIGGRSVLLLSRFDRSGIRRLPYISGMTAVQANDGDRGSALDLAMFLEEEGAQPERDIRELWLRMLFSCAVGNTDNHFRNFGFLHTENGWKLSPVFDVNPTPGAGEKYLATAVDVDDFSADPVLAAGVAEYYRWNKSEARDAAEMMAEALKGWRYAAHRCGIGDASIERMAGCLDAGRKRLEAAARR